MPSLSLQDLLTVAVVAALALWFLFFRNRGGAKLTREELLGLRKQGAQILDVRSPGEYAAGSIKGSRNIPLGDLPSRLGELKKDKPVLACCASGMRSGRAVGILRKAGFTQVHNAGPWQNLKD